MKERKVATKTQQIIIDSRYKTSGVENDYVIDLKGLQQPTGNTYSNVFFSSFTHVVGIRVLGVMIKDTIDVTPNVTDPTAIDFVCPQIPKTAQQLSATHGYVWCRVPLVRNYKGANNNNLQDQWWPAPKANTQFFAPQQLSELHISLYTNITTGTGPGGSELYGGAGSDAHPNFLIVEITSLDRIE